MVILQIVQFYCRSKLDESAIILVAGEKKDFWKYSNSHFTFVR